MKGGEGEGCRGRTRRKKWEQRKEWNGEEEGKREKRRKSDINYNFSNVVTIVTHSAYS